MSDRPSGPLQEGPLPSATQDVIALTLYLQAVTLEGAAIAIAMPARRSLAKAFRLRHARNPAAMEIASASP
jgi:hypothetical protein